MLEEQEAVRGRLFTIQDVLQSNVRAWLQVCDGYSLKQCFSLANVHIK